MEQSKEAEKVGQMLGPAMRLMEGITKDIVAKNVVSQFVEAEVGGLFEGGDEMTAGFLVKMQMEEANQDPKFVLKKFLRFYNSFRDFYLSLERSAEADANPPTMEEEVEGVDEEVEEEIQAEEADDSATEDTDKE